MLVELVPAVLPLVHGLFRLQQGLGGSLLHRLQHLQLRRQCRGFALPADQLGAILVEMALGLGQVALGLLQVLAQLDALSG